MSVGLYDNNDLNSLYESLTAIVEKPDLTYHIKTSSNFEKTEALINKILESHTGKAKLKIVVEFE